MIIQYIDDFPINTPEDVILRWIGDNFITEQAHKLIKLIVELECKKRRSACWRYMTIKCLAALTAARWNAKAAKAILIQTRVWR